MTASIDAQILMALQTEGRISNKALAGRVGLSPSACSERVRKLEAHGVIAGYVARLDQGVLGLTFEAWVMIVLPNAQPRAREDVVEVLRRHDTVTGSSLVAGPFDIIAHLVAADIGAWRHLDEDLRAVGVNARIAIVTNDVKPSTGVAVPPNVDWSTR